MFEAHSHEKWRHVQEKDWSQKVQHSQEQDKSSDIEQQPPFGDCK